MNQHRPALLACFVLGFALGIGAAVLWRTPEAPSVAMVTGDVEAQTRAVLSRDAPLERLAELGNLLSTLDADDVPAVLRAFETAPLDGGDPEIVMLAVWWSRFDPEAAFQWTKTDWRAGYGAVIAAVFRGWALSEPQRAFTIAQSLPFAGQQDLAMDSTIAGWDESAHGALMKFLKTLASPDQQRFGEIIARHRVLQLGPEGAIRWAEEIPDANLREIMSLRVASAIAARSADAPIAAAWAEPFVRTDGRLSGFPRRIATRWVLHDPDAAMAWLASLPAGDDRDDGVTEAFRDWSRRDYREADAWARSVEPARWNEPARAFHARTLARRFPENAMAIAMELEDPELREYTLVKIGRIWLDVDAEAARSWFAKSGLPDDLIRKATLDRRQVRGQKRAAVATENEDEP